MRMTATEFQRQFGYPPPDAPTGSKAQIRLPAPVKMNKTEAAWMEWLKRDFPGAVIEYESLTLRLPSGTKYTPDFIVSQLRAGSIATWDVFCFEVKGPYIHNSTSIEKFKAAKAAFPMFTFIFAQKTKDGWQTA